MSKENLINAIIEEELNHFLTVNNRGGKAICQENPDTFKLVRQMSHGVQTEEFLLSYTDDLREAREEGRNIMTEKYALMEQQLERTNFDENIEKIIEIEARLTEIVRKDYPKLFGTQDVNHFRKYLSCELQTLSAKSLQLYYENLIKSEEEGRNIIKERYQILMRLINLPPLD